jgi:Cdc6-like AAA superfamily ATPase
LSLSKKNISFIKSNKRNNDTLNNLNLNSEAKKTTFLSEIFKGNSTQTGHSPSFIPTKKRSRDKSNEKIKKIITKNDKIKNYLLNKSNKSNGIKNILQKKFPEKSPVNISKKEIPDNKPIDESYEDDSQDEESMKSFTEIRLEYLPCRKEEQDIIYNYIKKGLQTKGNYNSLYIAGMPGTGKTASVKTIINILESELKEAKKTKSSKELIQSQIVPFKKLFISGMEYPNISNVFKLIYNFIFSAGNKKNKQYTVNQYIQLLDEFFSERKKYNSSSKLNDPSNCHIILVIDEIDILINYTQNLLYNIFNWTTYEYSKLIVISISNTLDLPNRLFPKIKSRMGNNKIMFKPYTKEELKIIIQDKGIDLKLFSEDAIRLSCVKVAAINGDLRRIFQILARAKQLNELNHYKKNTKDKTQTQVSKYEILEAWNELYNSKISKVIQSLQIVEKIIISSMLSKIKDNNSNRIKIGDLYDRKDIFLEKFNENSSYELKITWEEFKRVIYNLMRIKLLSFYDFPKNNLIDNYVIIKFYTDEFTLACEEDQEFKPVLDFLTQMLNK